MSGICCQRCLKAPCVCEIQDEPQGLPRKPPMPNNPPSRYKGRCDVHGPHCQYGVREEEAGRKSHAAATEQPTRPGANDGQVRRMFRQGSALVARLNARPLVMQPYPQPVQTMTTAMAAKRGRKDSCTTR